MVELLLFTFIILTGIYIRSHRGKLSEKLVENKLSNLPGEYVMFNNVLFEGNGKSSQIDHIVVSPYGVFVIETKGYYGWILGSENGEYWTQNIYGKKYKFYNPIFQNSGHIRFLSYLLKDLYVPRFISIIVFDNRTDIKVNIRDNIVINRCHLENAILSFNEKIITSEQQARIVNRIKENAKDPANKQFKTNHKAYARKREYESKYNAILGLCPRCGGQLIRRQGKYGAFHGCSNYPKCRYTKKTH